MKKFYASVLTVVGLAFGGWAQNPGMIISEFLQNPGGTDSPFEYVELLATDDIDFTTTPYTIIVSNNGSGTANGWIEGGSLTYAFEITTGSVSVGDVVYVGGSSMAPTGTILRSIDTGTENGDGGIGNANSGGVFGNGGGNGDGIAVFDMAVGDITAASVPTDAVFYGSGIGSAFVSATEGYQMPVNDHYDGGKLAADDFFAPDENLTIVSGTFDLGLNAFVGERTYAGGAGTDGISDIALLEAAPPVFTFVLEDSTVAEDAGTVSLTVQLMNTNGTPSSGDIVIIAAGTATSPDDFILMDTTLSFDGLADGTTTFNIEVEDDAVAEQSEYIIITMDNFDNAELEGLEQTFLYITDNDRILPGASNELKLELLTSFSTGVEEESSAEIVVFDTTLNRLFVANSIANQVDVIDFSTPETPVLIESIGFDSVGFINSVAVHAGVLAVAVQAPVAQDPGFISFWNVDGTFLNRLTVGALPDMVSFNHAGTQLIAACEGEPNDDYTVDPNGGVSIIELSHPITDLTAEDVTNLDFTAFDADEAELKAAGVRIFGLGASVAQDLEPEYVTVLEDDQTAYVVLQENNAIAVVDLETKTITEILPLGTIDHSLFGYGLDASNRTSGINIANFAIKGMFQPDAIANINIGGNNYLVTANEGDSRDYDGYSEEERVDDLELDSEAYPFAEYLQDNHLLGRLKTTSATGDTDGDGDIDEIHSYGTRSFTIWNDAGEMVFDSGDWIEQLIANDPAYQVLFNAHNEGGELETKDRSDDKGPEPEGVVTTFIDGNAFLFVSLERVGGVMVFNINDPENPSYIGYHNNRDAETNGPDRGAEGMIFIDAEISPNDKGLLILANEVSSTLSIYEVNSCINLSDLALTTPDDLTAFCEGDSLEITATDSEALTYQWNWNGEAIDAAVESSYFAAQAGFYQVSFSNETEACEGKTDSLFITENELPLVEATASEDTICFDAEVVFNGTGAATYEWDVDGIVNGTPYTPTEAGLITYTVTGTDENGCQNMADVEVLMAEEVELTITTTDETLGDDGAIDLTVSGGIGDYIFDWDNDETGDFDDEEDLVDLVAGTYVVIVEDEFGCTATETITVNSQVGLPENSGLVFGIYPNPTQGEVVLQLGNSVSAVQVDIVDITGNRVANFQITGTSEQLDLSDLITGVYLVRVTQGDEAVTQKLIVR